MANPLRSSLSRRRFLAVGGGAASAALLASCTGTGSGSGSGATGPPQPGGTYTFSSPTGVNSTLDLHNTGDPATYRFISPICSKLVEFKTGPDVPQTSQEVVPDLAREWEISEDGLTYTFHLRDNVTWHDVPPVSGRPFVADDVIATFEDIITRPAFHDWMFERVADMQAPDDHTLVIRMNQAYSPFLGYLAYAWNVILPREHFEGKFDINTMTIGTGPFMLDTYQQDEQMIRVRNPNYFIQGRPYLDELNHVVIPERNSALAAFNSGRINTTDVPAEQLSAYERRDDITLRTTGYVPVFLYLQTLRQSFDDLRVRRAIAMAIDFEGMGETIYPGQWELCAAIPSNCGEFALSPEEIRRLRPFDPDQARRLLAEAGYPNGFDTTMMVQQLSPLDVDGAEYMLQDLREVGINAEMQVLDTSTAVERRVNGEFDMAKSVRSINLPDIYLRDYEIGGALNYANFEDQHLQSMIEESRGPLSHEERVSLFHDIARYMETEISAAIAGVSYTSTIAVSGEVQNYHSHQYITGGFWADVWMNG